jgi:serine protease Do
MKSKERSFSISTRIFSSVPGVPVIMKSKERNFSMHAAKVSLALAAVLTMSGWAACVGVAQAQETPQQATTEQKESAQHEELLRARKSAATFRLKELSLDLQHQQVGTHSIGVTVVPADSTLRAQLGLPSEQGLVVTNVDLNSPAWEAGVAQHDVLLRLSDKPLTNPDDLSKQVDAVGEKPAGLEAIRQGKRIKLQVTPRPTARLALTLKGKSQLTPAVQSRFWIGVELGGADETLRAQLKLPEGQGVAVNKVIDDSPAAKAGIKKHDVLLLLGDKPIPSAEAFRENLQEVGEKPVAIKLIREGKTISIEVTPQKHQEPTHPDLSVSVFDYEGLAVELVRPAAIPVERRWLQTKVKIPVDKDLPTARLQELIDQVKDFQKKLEALSEDWKKKETPSAEPTEKK